MTKQPEHSPNCISRTGAPKCNCGAAPSSPEPATAQDILTKWAAECFGDDLVNSPVIRALRLVEEAIEFSQAVQTPAAKLHALIDYVYAKPAGTPFQELGGVAVTALVAASSIGARFDDCLAAEQTRVLATPREHFAQRNQVKLEAGFDAPAPTETAAPSTPAATCLYVYQPGGAVCGYTRDECMHNGSSSVRIPSLGRHDFVPDAVASPSPTREFPVAGEWAVRDDVSVSIPSPTIPEKEETTNSGCGRVLANFHDGTPMLCNEHNAEGTCGHLFPFTVASVADPFPSETPAPVPVEGAPNDAFWQFCEENAINGALRIDEKWRVDDVAVKFAESFAASRVAHVTSTNLIALQRSQARVESLAKELVTRNEMYEGMLERADDLRDAAVLATAAEWVARFETVGCEASGMQVKNVRAETAEASLADRDREIAKLRDELEKKA